MSARYRLSLCIEFSAGDDSAARSTVTRNLDVFSHVGDELRACIGSYELPASNRATVKLKLQRLNDDAPPRALVVETL